MIINNSNIQESEKMCAFKNNTVYLCDIDFYIQSRNINM